MDLISAESNSTSRRRLKSSTPTQNAVNTSSANTNNTTSPHHLIPSNSKNVSVISSAVTTPSAADPGLEDVSSNNSTSLNVDNNSANNNNNDSFRIIAIAVGPILAIILLGLFIWILKRKGFFNRHPSYIDDEDESLHSDHYHHPKHEHPQKQYQYQPKSDDDRPLKSPSSYPLQQTFRYPDIQIPYSKFSRRHNTVATGDPRFQLPHPPPTRLHSVPIHGPSSHKTPATGFPNRNDSKSTREFLSQNHPNYPVARQYTVPQSRHPTTKSSRGIFFSSRTQNPESDIEDQMSILETQMTSNGVPQDLLDMYGVSSHDHSSYQDDDDESIRHQQQEQHDTQHLETSDSDEKSDDHLPSRVTRKPTRNIVPTTQAPPIVTIPDHSVTTTYPIPPSVPYHHQHSHLFNGNGPQMESMTSEETIPEYSEWLESVHEPAAMSSVPAIRLMTVSSNEKIPSSPSHEDENNLQVDAQQKDSATGEKRKGKRHHRHDPLSSSVTEEDYNPSSSRRSHRRRQSQKPYEVWAQKRISHKGTHLIGHYVQKSQWKLGGLKYVSREEQKRIRAQRRQEAKSNNRESAVSRISRFSRATRRSAGKSVIWQNRKTRAESVAGGSSSVYDSFHVW